MKTTTEVQEALKVAYSGPTKEKNGMTYIPWNYAVEAANALFDPDGWDSQIMEYHRETITNEEGKETNGYAATVRVTVFTSDGRPVTRDGLGFNEMQFTRNGEAMIDPAIKGAASGAILRALVLFGSAFGLDLYHKDGTSAPHTSGGSTAAPANGSAPKYPASEKQQASLRKNGVPGAIIGLLSGKKASEIMGYMWDQHMEVREAVEAAGFAWVEEEKKKDGLPLGA